MLTLTFPGILEERKQNTAWVAQAFNYQQKPLPEIAEAFYKCAALTSKLELPVGEFIQEELARHPKLSDDPVEHRAAIELMEMNAKDEGNHYAQIKYLNKLLDIPQEYFEEAERIAGHLKDIAEVIGYANAAFRIEIGWFLTNLAMLRAWSSSGSASTTVGLWINQDEIYHTYTGMLVTNKLGYRKHPLERKLCIDIMEWVLETIPETHTYPTFRKDFWRKGQKELYEGYFTNQYRQLSYIRVRKPYEHFNAEIGYEE